MASNVLWQRIFRKLAFVDVRFALSSRLFGRSSPGFRDW